MLKKSKVGLLLYLALFLQRFNIVLTYVIFIFSFLVVYSFSAWILYQNILLFYPKYFIIVISISVFMKCGILPLKELIMVFVIGTIENHDLVLELLNLPTSLLKKLNFNLTKEKSNYELKEK